MIVVGGVLTLALLVAILSAVNAGTPVWVPSIANTTSASATEG
jgi:hypothetical protein